MSKTSPDLLDRVEAIHNEVAFVERTESLRKLAARGIPVAAGGAPVGIVEHPLLPPTVSGTDITVDAMLNSPTRVTRMVADLTLQRFLADRLFSSPGGVSGGAVIYDQATLNELYATRDVQRVLPGEEFPIVTGDRQMPKIAEVEKDGGKFWISDEARDRNNSSLYTNRVRQLANTLVRKLNAKAIATVEASITATGQTFTGVSWSTVTTGGSAQSNNSLWPLRDFVKAAQLAETMELGVNYNLVLLNPVDYANLLIVYGASNLPAVIDSLNYSLFVSNRVPAGTAYFVEEGAVGELRVEKPLSTETWREEATQRNWTQTDVRAVMYVTNPYSVLKVTGIA